MRALASGSGAAGLPPFHRHAGPPHRYALALGSNRRHGRHGAPARVLEAALARLEREGVRIARRSRTVATPALGPGGRRYANAAALVETSLAPPELLLLLKRVERAFGRRGGRRWGARVLDLDIALWSGGGWSGPGLRIPHAHMATRRFVLDPLLALAPGWPAARGRTVRHLHARLTRPRPLHR